jgi:hypothetical protein
MYSRYTSQLLSKYLKSKRSNYELAICRPIASDMMIATFIAIISLLITIGSADAQYGTCTGEEIAALKRTGASNVQICQYCGLACRQPEFTPPRPGGGRSGPYATQRRAYEVMNQMASRGMNCHVQTVSDEYYVVC